MPFDVAMSLSDIELYGYAIIFKEFELPEDQHFDFKAMKFREPKK